jgi:hypothetical protein
MLSAKRWITALVLFAGLCCAFTPAFGQTAKRAKNQGVPTFGGGSVSENPTYPDLRSRVDGSFVVHAGQ